MLYTRPLWMFSRSRGLLTARAMHSFQPLTSACASPLLMTSRRMSFTPSAVWRNSKAEGAAPVNVTAESFAKLTPMVLLEGALQQHAMLAGTAYASKFEAERDHIVISREKFNKFCALAHVEDTTAALEALHEAAIVVSLDGGARVHLRPVQYLEEMEVVNALHSQGSASTPAGGESLSEKALTDFAMPAPFLLEEVNRRIAELESQEQAMRKQLEPAIARAARWRRSVWGGALLYAGAQLAVIARLTYFDLDWDTMEPVSYCLGIGTALLFYLYYLYFDTEHTYTDFDKRFLPRRVHKYAPKDFDWAAYNALCQALADERAMRENLRKWANEH